MIELVTIACVNMTNWTRECQDEWKESYWMKDNAYMDK